MVDLARLIRTACLLEASAPKPGNVHPGAAFDDLCFDDFLAAADAVAPVLARAQERGVGRTILDSVRATGRRVDGNVNLGIILLIAPLAAVPPDVPLPEGVPDVLERLTQQDAALAYRAIRLARPAGLGQVDDEDVAKEPTGTLREAMQLAAERDAVAGQYAGNFDLVLSTGVPLLASMDDFAANRERAVVRLHLTLMAISPDTLIARKRGEAEAAQSAARAQAVLDAGWPTAREGRDKLVELDRWLRAEGNARNPGTTADLVAATLFAALRDGAIGIPPGFD